MRRMLWLVLAGMLLAPPLARAQLNGPVALSVQDAGACATANACARFGVPSSPGLAIDVSGTWTGTLTFEASIDGTTWNSVLAVLTSSGASVTTTTGNGTFAITNFGFGFVRVRAGTLASGTANVVLRTGYGTRGGGGSFTGGTLASPLLFLPDNTVDIGANGATRPRTGYFGTSIDVQRAALASTSTDAGLFENTTAATGGATVQMSPRLRFCGNAWDTAASETVCFFSETLPATAATPTGSLNFGYSLNGAAATYPMSLASTGDLTITNRLIATGSVKGAALDLGNVGPSNGFAAVPDAGGFFWSTRALLVSPATNKIKFENLAADTGVLADFSANNVLKFRSLADTGDAKITIGTTGAADESPLTVNYNGTAFAKFSVSGTGSFKFLDLISAGNLVSWPGGNVSATNTGVVKWRDAGSVTHGVETHINNSSNNGSPTLAANWGTGPTLPTTSGDSFGRATVGTTPNGTTLTVTFKVAFAGAPICTSVNESTSVNNVAVATTSALTITGTFVAGNIVNWACAGGPF